MENQQFKNHSKYVFGYHYIGGALCFVLLVGSIINVVNSSHENLYSASLLVLVSILLILIAYYARAFALKAQDRAIKAEEKLRHFILTGEALSNDVNVRQIIGLRFASDEEFPGLVKRAASEKLREKEIKKLIKNWKSDNYRV